jgi:multidrug efflux pump subunit AcrB
MTTPPNTLETLNALRAKLGQPPLKKWKESQTRLVETIALLQNNISRISAQSARITKVPTAVADGAYKTNTEAAILTGHTTEGPTKATKKELRRLEREANKKTKKTAASAPATTKIKSDKSSASGVSLVAIAKRIPMEGRHARQKMRRLYSGDVSKLPKRIDDGWLFTPKDADKIEKLLRADHRKN